ncbi:hypothetical protein TVAG_488890 [Trichomonas vaginalis G3]|uniref:Uncharacterized protein n=1 Tax=Trichomonas vaginalis (strain ATCC PRA-98 / G3) TaxID=412133 RepID=A2FL61_TRIV3|nr:hypothetical protein TVAGG3_0426990 [Trichomonas vaginalis G3]EAX94350.1 hypothetical protein TVAG_488890 [Trichomonas vaginalis G3]KAI5536486.1 hypothetical protein TVAGG3_0426990 [Trichomonas vaginalis G3]|eukprot:XP_001307280.1 hypothetical protein [Trichomonas vaginalis G3]
MKPNGNELVTYNSMKQKLARQKQLKISWNNLVNSAIKKKRITVLSCAINILQLTDMVKEKRLKTYFEIWIQRKNTESNQRKWSHVFKLLKRKSILEEIQKIQVENEENAKRIAIKTKNVWISMTKKLQYKEFSYKILKANKNLRVAWRLHQYRSKWLVLIRKVVNIHKCKQFGAFRNWYLIGKRILTDIEVSKKNHNFKIAKLTDKWFHFSNLLKIRSINKNYNNLVGREKWNKITQKYLKQNKSNNFHRSMYQYHWIKLSTQNLQKNTIQSALQLYRSDMQQNGTMWLPLPQVYKLCCTKCLLYKKSELNISQDVQKKNSLHVKWIRWSCKLKWITNYEQLQYAQQRFQEKDDIMKRLQHRKLNAPHKSPIQPKIRTFLKVSEPNHQMTKNQPVNSLNYVKNASLIIESKPTPQLDIHLENIEIPNNENSFHDISTQNKYPDMSNTSTQKSAIQDLSTNDVSIQMTHPDLQTASIQKDDTGQNLNETSQGSSEIYEPRTTPTIINIYNYPLPSSGRRPPRQRNTSVGKSVIINQFDENDFEEESQSEIQPNFTVDEVQTPLAMFPPVVSEKGKTENASPIPTYAPVSPKRNMSTSYSYTANTTDWLFESQYSELNNSYNTSFQNIDNIEEAINETTQEISTKISLIGCDFQVYFIFVFYV